MREKEKRTDASSSTDGAENTDKRNSYWVLKLSSTKRVSSTHKLLITSFRINGLWKVMLALDGTVVKPVNKQF